MAISGVISPLIWVITIVTLLITPLITTHEHPSRDLMPQVDEDLRFSGAPDRRLEVERSYKP